MLTSMLLLALQVFAPADTGSIPAGAFRLRYRVEGTGTPAIVIGSSIYYPRIFSPALRRHLRMVFLDHRGFAPPPAHPVDTTGFALDTLLDDIERALGASGAERGRPRLACLPARGPWEGGRGRSARGSRARGRSARPIAPLHRKLGSPDAGGSPASA